MNTLIAALIVVGLFLTALLLMVVYFEGEKKKMREQEKEAVDRLMKSLENFKRDIEEARKSFR